jgi:hypothetical protein
LNVVSFIRTFDRSKPAGLGVDGFGATEDFDGVGVGLVLGLGDGLDVIDKLGEGLEDGLASGFLPEHDARSSASVRTAMSEGGRCTLPL